MTTLLFFIAKLVYFFLSAGVANMAPVLGKNSLRMLAKPIDAGHTFAGQPLFGSHKTWRGLLLGTCAGGVFFLVQHLLAEVLPQTASWSVFDMRLLPWWFGFPFATAALCGDLVKSFFKRRVHIAPGKSWFPFDQIDFLLGASVVALIFVDYSPLVWILILLVGPVFHILVNYTGYWLRLKDSPW